VTHIAGMAKIDNGLVKDTMILAGRKEIRREPLVMYGIRPIVFMYQSQIISNVLSKLDRGQKNLVIQGTQTVLNRLLVLKFPLLTSGIVVTENRKQINVIWEDNLLLMAGHLGCGFEKNPQRE